MRESRGENQGMPKIIILNSCSPSASREGETKRRVLLEYEAMKERIENGDYSHSRPDNWGGYQIKVHFFEFWEANDDRLNYRECYEKDNESWSKYFLQSWAYLRSIKSSGLIRSSFK